jgi:hypothetical protein
MISERTQNCLVFSYCFACSLIIVSAPIIAGFSLIFPREFGVDCTKKPQACQEDYFAAGFLWFIGILPLICGLVMKWNLEQLRPIPVPPDVNDVLVEFKEELN